VTNVSPTSGSENTQRTGAGEDGRSHRKWESEGIFSPPKPKSFPVDNPVGFVGVEPTKIDNAQVMNFSWLGQCHIGRDAC